MNFTPGALRKALDLLRKDPYLNYLKREKEKLEEQIEDRQQVLKRRAIDFCKKNQRVDEKG